MTDRREVGAAVASAMNRCGMTQADVARRAGVSVATVRAMQYGEARRWRQSTVRAVEDALGIAGGLSGGRCGCGCEAEAVRLRREVAELRRRVTAARALLVAAAV